MNIQSRHILVALVVISVVLIAGCSSLIIPTSKNQPLNVKSLTGTKSKMSVNTVNNNIQPTAQNELDHLNNWDSDAMDVASCSEEYSRQYSQYLGKKVDIVDLGETNGWIFMHKSELAELGYKIRWNCTIGKFEIVVPEGQSANICSCQRIFTTPTPP